MFVQASLSEDANYVKIAQLSADNNPLIYLITI